MGQLRPRDFRPAGRGEADRRAAESSGSYPASGGRLQGCPQRGVRPHRWGCGCRARTALSDRGAGVLRAASRPASRLVRRPEPTDATSPMRPLVRAPPRAPRVGQGVRPPAASADAVGSEWGTCSAAAWGRPASTRPTRLPRPRFRRPGRPAGRFDRSTRLGRNLTPLGQHRAGPVGPRRGPAGARRPRAPRPRPAASCSASSSRRCPSGS